MPLKAVLGDQEWEIFFFAQTWWETFKISFTVIFVTKNQDLFLKT